MDVGVIGLNCQIGDLSLRESFARVIVKFLESLESSDHIVAFPLLTCNRAEIYFSSANLYATCWKFEQFIDAQFPDDTFPGVYSYFGAVCFQHLIRVTSGLDSALLGETEIQGQVKKSYLEACAHKKLSPSLHYLFQKSLKIAKDLRNIWVHQMPRSHFEKSAWELLKETTQFLEEPSILFVGASEINYKLLKYLKHKFPQRVTFTNRTMSGLVEIQQKESTGILSWDQLDSWIDYDVVIVGTKAGKYLLNASEKKIKTKIILDLSVPRNVNPSLAKTHGIVLFNIDQIHERGIREFHKEEVLFDQIHLFVDNAVDKYVSLYQKKQQDPIKFLAAVAS